MSVKPKRKEIRSRMRHTRLTQEEDKKLVRLSKRLKLTPSSYLQFLVQRAR